MRLLAMHALSGVAVVALGTHIQAATCEALSRVSLPNTRIIQSHTMPTGDFNTPGVPATAPLLRELPAFCRVTALDANNRFRH